MWSHFSHDDRSFSPAITKSHTKYSKFSNFEWKKRLIVRAHHSFWWYATSSASSFPRHRPLLQSSSMSEMCWWLSAFTLYDTTQPALCCIHWTPALFWRMQTNTLPWRATLSSTTSEHFAYAHKESLVLLQKSTTTSKSSNNPQRNKQHNTALGEACDTGNNARRAKFCWVFPLYGMVLFCLLVFSNSKAGGRNASHRVKRELVVSSQWIHNH